ncbi:preprotein translocase subunit SecG [Sinimarinibacterium sp. NLF-5-8]|uniref:preprotein translocase subunit SecG n=1 Tax=Sinimarinibacterium sp. NLF-5-8 TaxID=2698684 RepID=UPI00137C100F|nr:preprotein translocase subunit SecG [Sinimarinibacterium sp. NLF-5-8]QHS09550.1 preprotein translocase subunit SecG [Sinimarinibacterium sp. NLF-5-8]
MHTALVIIQLLISIALLGLILLQHGKGADAGAAFGSGASGTVFGARGSANFMSRATAWLAGGFFITSLALAYLVHGEKQSTSVVDRLASPAVEQVESTPSAALGPDDAPHSSQAIPAPSEAGNNQDSAEPVIPE